MQVPRHILPTIVIAQFCCTSLWFAGNGVAVDLMDTFGLEDGIISYLTSSIQFGFIIGTLVFAIFNIADRYSPSLVFMCCALLGALSSLGILYHGNTLISLLSIRFITGFFLAGIYPVGMKIAADYYQAGLGKSLGYLVGALVLGTALPHFLKSLELSFSWTYVIIVISVLAAVGGIGLFGLVPDGPHRRASSKFDYRSFLDVFKKVEFRKAAFGYFGHMWELYAFWAFVPVILTYYAQWHQLDFNISFYSFLVIAIGSIGCVTAGYLSSHYSNKIIARIALMISGLCCLLSPIFIGIGSSYLMIIFLLIWGFTVIADSPLFSTLVAHSASPSTKGTALTIVNCIGFSITIVSIQLLNYLSNTIDMQYIFLVLAIGPIWGLWSIRTLPASA